MDQAVLVPGSCRGRSVISAALSATPTARARPRPAVHVPSRRIIAAWALRSARVLSRHCSRRLVINSYINWRERLRCCGN